MRPADLVADFWHVATRLAASVVVRGRPEAWRRPPPGADPGCAAVPVVLLPGIYEPWRYLGPLGRALHTAGHPVHVVEKLGLNVRDLPRSVSAVRDVLLRDDAAGAVLVGHSKGGLIGKAVLLDREAGRRARGLVTVNTPFAGSRWALPRIGLGWTPLGLFVPSGSAIAGLTAQADVNARITSVRAAWDQMVPGATELPGARNVTLELGGHFRPVADAGVHGLLHDEVHRLAPAPRGPQRVIAIAIVGRNGVIGDGSSQPFSYAEDWARYKRVTLGHPMIMGRRTHDAIGRFLPGRTTIIVTRDPASVAVPAGVDAHVVGSVDAALALATALDDTVFVAGGGEVYRQAWPHLTELDLTEVHADAPGSVRFPVVEAAEWVEVRREPREEFDFVGYRRRAVAPPTAVAT